MATQNDTENSNTFDMNSNVSDYLESWGWQEQFGSSTDPNYHGPSEYDPAKFGYSYSEFRQQRPYHRTASDVIYKEYITSLMPLRHNDAPDLHPNEYQQNEIYSTISKCLSQQIPIPPTDLLIGALYSSYHLVSPYIMPTIKYLLITYSDNIHVNVTSISNPRYTVPHIAAMSNDVSLLQIFYEMEGSNIDIIDGSSFTPLHISLGKRNFTVSHALLWMNCRIDEQLLIRKLKSFRLRHVMNSVSCLQHFALEMENAFSTINQCLTMQWNLNRDIIQSLVSYLLPMATYSVVHSILNQLETGEINKEHVEFPQYAVIVNEARECLNKLDELKEELLSTAKSGVECRAKLNEHKEALRDHRNLLNAVEPRIILYNLFAMTQDDGMGTYLHGDEYNVQRWKDQIRLVMGKGKKKGMFDKETDDKKSKQKSGAKGAVMGFVAATAAFIAVRGMKK